MSIKSNQKDADKETVLTAFQKLIEVVEKLRGPGGCPWDKEQTQESLTPYIIEEAFELSEAIRGKEKAEIIDELGDYLFQVVLQAQIASESHQFTIEDVLKNLSEKMIRRHPHVFSDIQWKTSAEVLVNWDALKDQEKKSEKTETKKIFSHPKNLPALYAAQKIGRKTKNWDFDWATSKEVFEKLNEEVLELKKEFESGNSKGVEEELGDVLFTLAQLARHLNLQAEDCAHKANEKFQKRFMAMVKPFLENKDHWLKLTSAEKEICWQNIKLLDPIV